MTLTQLDSMNVDLEKFRLDDPAVQADPFNFYPALREERPVFKTEASNMSWWVVSCRRDITQILMDPDTFSSRVLPGETAFLLTDPPKHGALRATVAPWFARTAMSSLREVITVRACELVSAAVVAGTCDAVTDIGLPLTLFTICRMMGVPAGGIRRLHELGPLYTQFMYAQLIKGTPSVEACEAAAEVENLLGRFIDEGGYEPDGVVALLVDQARSGVLSRAEFAGTFLLLYGAGHTTTTNLIANSVYMLSQRPADLDKIASDPAFAASFLEEVLRTRPSFQRIQRITTREVEIGGVTIPQGSMVRLLLGSANRDPEFYDDPETFDPDKKRRMHIAFGQGIHTCLGNWLARLEGTIVLEAIGREVGRIDPDPASSAVPQAGGSFNDFGFTSLPVVLTPSQQAAY